MNSVIVGMFDNQEAANDAKDKLLAAGFANDTVVVSDEDIATMRTDSIVGSTSVQPEPEKEGAISRFFSSIFGDGDDGRSELYGESYREALRRGHYGVSVSTRSEDEEDRAERILNSCGAFDIDERSQQWRGEGWVARGDTGLTDTTSATSATSATPVTSAMPVTPVTSSTPVMAGEVPGTLEEISEELKVGKRVVARGGVRVFSRMIETPVEETVRLREERVDVQRRAVDRPATEADFAQFKEGSVEVREMSEEVVVEKEARVVGEVDIGKTVIERDETVRDTVRETHVEVESIDPQAVPTLPGNEMPPGVPPVKPM